MPTSLEATLAASAQRFARDLMQAVRASRVEAITSLAGVRPDVKLHGGSTLPASSAAVASPTPRSGAARIARAAHEIAAEHSLSEREEQMLLRTAHGATRAELAKHFGVAIQTMKLYIRTMLRKLGAENLLDAAARVMQRAVNFP